MTARDLLTWNEVTPTFRVVSVSPPEAATETFAVVADYGWAERLLCSGSYFQDAEAVALACTEACR